MDTVRPVKKAFLVGVSDYGDPKGGDLPGCKIDVAVLGKVLRRKGFECYDWVDQPLAGLLPNGELEHFFSDAKRPEDTIIFYFSGHGVDIAGEQMLRGRGVRTASLKSGVTTGNLLVLSSVLDELSKFAAQKIVIVDACRIAEQGEGLADSLQRSRRTAFKGLSNCVVIYASADGTESYTTPTNDGSRFTLSFAEELKEYGRGVLATVEATMERVSAYRDGKSQIPWIYASLRDRPLDGYRIEEEKLIGMCFPKHIGAAADGMAWAVLSGSLALAKYKGDAFVYEARLPAAFSASMYSFHPHPDGGRYAFVKGLSRNVHEVTVSRAGASWQTSQVSVKRLKLENMTRVFGAWWSPAGIYLAAFGAPTSGLVGAALWSKASGRFKRESVVGLPSNLEFNSLAWFSENGLLVAGSQDASSSSHVFLLERQDNVWKASFLWKTSSALRITSMLVAKDQNHVYLGADDGSVAMGILSEPIQPMFFSRAHATTGFKSLALMPWKRSSRQLDSVEIGVCAMAFDEPSRVLALTYFDGTAAFWDPILGSYVKAFSLSRGARRPAIISTEPGSFLCADGERGRQFKVVAN